VARHHPRARSNLAPLKPAPCFAAPRCRPFI
jgi:hypothetical protein